MDALRRPGRRCAAALVLLIVAPGFGRADDSAERFARELYDITRSADVARYRALLHPLCGSAFKEDSFRLRGDLLKKLAPGASVDALGPDAYEEKVARPYHLPPARNPFNAYTVPPAYVAVVWGHLPDVATGNRVELNPFTRLNGEWRILESGCLAQARGFSANFSGDVGEGETYRSTYLGQGLEFLLIPQAGGERGWTVTVRRQAGTENFASITPPFHGPNPIDVNVEDLMKDAVRPGQGRREFRFVTNAKDFAQAQNDIARYTRGGAPKDCGAACCSFCFPFGTGTLELRGLQPTAPGSGRYELSFTAELEYPAPAGTF